ncbi:GNAT family N-acetyltransferase [Streptomyces sp. NPDC051577]|uniref:GNAT family N-acetyltransferase n=1 Tax=Streptomyces sp. NPDC051577 TaxID=3155166 RepID=UPI00343A8FC5
MRTTGTGRGRGGSCACSPKAAIRARSARTRYGSGRTASRSAGPGSTDRRTPPGGVTVGFGLIPAARGRGYAAEALRALLDHARAHGARGVDGDADRENVASQRVMAAAGMRFLREDDRLRHHAVTWTDR